MAKDDVPNQFALEVNKLLGRFRSGGDLRPVEDRDEWDKLVASKSPDERELLEQLARFSDLWRYFQEQKQKLGSEIVNRLRGLNKLPVAERIVELKDINQKLMERVGDAGQRA
jgi:hypothetical protein